MKPHENIVVELGHGRTNPAGGFARAALPRTAHWFPVYTWGVSLSCSIGTVGVSKHVEEMRTWERYLIPGGHYPNGCV